MKLIKIVVVSLLFLILGCGSDMIIDNTKFENITPPKIVTSMADTTEFVYTENNDYPMGAVQYRDPLKLSVEMDAGNYEYHWFFIPNSSYNSTEIVTLFKGSENSFTTFMDLQYGDSYSDFYPSSIKDSSVYLIVKDIETGFIARDTSYIKFSDLGISPYFTNRIHSSAADAGTNWSLRITAQDDDYNDELTYSISDGPVGLELRGSFVTERELIWDNPSEGTHSITLKVEDKVGNSDLMKFSLIVSAGVAADSFDIITTIEFGLGTVSPSDSIRLERGESSTFTFNPSNGYMVNYIVVNNVNVGKILEYPINSISERQDIKVFFIDETTVTNEYPTAEDSSTTIDFNGSKEIDIAALIDDADLAKSLTPSEELTVTVSSPTNAGTAVLKTLGGTIIEYSHTSTSLLKDTIEYTVSDIASHAVSGKIIITVNESTIKDTVDLLSMIYSNGWSEMAMEEGSRITISSPSNSTEPVLFDFVRGVGDGQDIWPVAKAIGFFSEPNKVSLAKLEKVIVNYTVNSISPEADGISFTLGEWAIPGTNFSYFRAVLNNGNANIGTEVSDTLLLSDFGITWGSDFIPEETTLADAIGQSYLTDMQSINFDIESDEWLKTQSLDMTLHSLKFVGKSGLKNDMQ